MPDRNPGRLSNWKIVCFHCRAEFLDAEKVQAIADHFANVHDGAPAKLELVWIGLGPAPKAMPKIGGA